MNYEQYTKTKGQEAIVLDENYSREANSYPAITYRPRGRGWNNVPNRLPYWMWKELQNARERSQQTVIVQMPSNSKFPWNTIKSVIITVVVAPIVVIELGLLLRFLFER